MADRYDPFKDESLGTPQAKPKRRSPARIDWRSIAGRMAAGEKPVAIAAGLGLPEERIWRHLGRSVHFQADLQRAVDRQRLLNRLVFATAGQQAAMAHLAAPDRVDDETARWLAGQTGLASGDDAGEESVDLVSRLGGVAWRPLRRRPSGRAARSRVSPEEAAEYAAMQAGLEEWARTRALERARGEAEASGSIRNDAEATGSVWSEAEATGSIRNDVEASGSAGSAAEASGSIRSDAEAPAHGVPPAGIPRRRPVLPVAATRPPTIVDIEGPDLARLRAAGLIGPPPAETGGSDRP